MFQILVIILLILMLIIYFWPEEEEKTINYNKIILCSDEHIWIKRPLGDTHYLQCAKCGFRPLFDRNPDED